jgi:hypothetical protein
MNPWNYSQLTDTSVCDGGLGCLFRNINVIGNGWPYLTIFFLSYFIITFVMVNKGNHFLKSFTTSTYVMLIISIISLVFGMISQKTMLILGIGLSIMSAINVYLMRKY